jgi:hypothetical protein
MRWLQKLVANLNYQKGLILSFIFGFMVRLIPEVLSYPHPIGFDTITYAARLKRGVVWHDWTSAFSTWLLYALLTPMYSMLKGDPFLLLKFMTPMLYALNVCGVYYFARKALNWETKICLIAALLFSLQLASLRISWDLYRNMLGFAILLFMLPWVGKVGTKKGLFLIVLLSMLVVFTHEYVAVIMFAAVFTVVIADVRMGHGAKALKVLVAVLPALLIVIAGVSLNMFPAPTFVTDNVVEVNDAIYPRPGGLFFLIDYFGPVSSLTYPTYLDLFSHVLSLFLVLYLLSLPLVLVGFFRHPFLDGWTLLLLIGTFDALLTPILALDFWHRSAFLLVYPFTFYAVNGIKRVLESKKGSIEPKFRRLRWMKVSKKTMRGIILLTLLFGLILMSSPLFFERYGAFSIPTTSMYLPSSMLKNTIPLGDTPDTVKVMEWLNGYMEEDAAVLIHHVFLPWAELYLDNGRKIFYFALDINKALNKTLEQGFTIVYFVWWNENIGWYDLSVPRDFVIYFSSGRISVFKRL